MGSTPQTGRVESCNAGEPVEVAEKIRFAVSAAPAVPHHSTRVRPLAGTSMVCVALSGSSNTKPSLFKFTATLNGFDVLLLRMAAINTWSPLTRKRGVTGRTSHGL